MLIQNCMVHVKEWTALNFSFFKMNKKGFNATLLWVIFGLLVGALIAFMMFRYAWQGASIFSP